MVVETTTERTFGHNQKGASMLTEGQAGMVEEHDHQAAAVAHSLDAVLGLIGDLGHAVTGEVGQPDAH